MPGTGSPLPLPVRFEPQPAPLDHIHRELKRQFDPAGIFNRMRLYPEF
jgi:glycolate oxidase FAD binding subunit